MSAALTIEDVTKSYGDKTVLKQVGFSAGAGEFIVLVGPSGCGKSTMLRAVAGLETVDSGAIMIDDRDVTTYAPKDRDIAMVFQDYALYPHKSVYENIAFGLRIRKVKPAKVDELVLDAARKLSLTPYLKRRPAALSGGQRQRVAIGRAIVRDPKVFLFDEPLSNLDAKLRGTMRIEIAKLHKDLRATILYVTHDQIEAMTLADRIAVMHAGIIQQMGPPLELYYHPANVFVATFIGSPPMNIIEGELVAMEGGLKFVAAGGLEYVIPEDHAKRLAAANSEKKVLWGLRAENLAPKPEGFSGGSGTAFSAHVVVTELLGPTTSAICDVNGHEILASLSAPFRPKAGDKIDLVVKSKHLYLFDKESGKALV